MEGNLLNMRQLNTFLTYVKVKVNMRLFLQKDGLKKGTEIIFSSQLGDLFQVETKNENVFSISDQRYMSTCSQAEGEKDCYKIASVRDRSYEAGGG